MNLQSRSRILRNWQRQKGRVLNTSSLRFGDQMPTRSISYGTLLTKKSAGNSDRVTIFSRIVAAFHGELDVSENTAMQNSTVVTETTFPIEKTLLIAIPYAKYNGSRMIGFGYTPTTRGRRDAKYIGPKPTWPKSKE